MFEAGVIPGSMQQHMVRLARVLIIPLIAFAANAQAQQKAPPVPNTPPAIIAPATDSAKDTTAVEKAVSAVTDSVVAQVRAPIVQIPVTPRSLVIPGALFAYGVATLNYSKLREINETAQELVWNGKTYKSPYPEDYLLLAPAAAVYALNIIGVKGLNNLVDRSILYGMSNAIANGLSFGIKTLSIETRPDNSDRYSFPSGHTAEAFVSAEFLHLEYRGRVHWTVIGAGYAVGVGTAYLRMAHNKHWLSDVVAGAGIGIASTRFSYYLYPILKNWIFGSRKIRGDAMIMPGYQNGMFGVSAIARF